MKILIAEDDRTSRDILHAILLKWGYDPLVVIDGNAAWDLLQKPGCPNLLILDWNMPGLDGIEVCRRVREKESPDPPYIIILTARGEKSSIVEGLEMGANDYITKPYDIDELRARIRVGQRMLELQSDLNKTKNALAHEAMHDPLTGVLNRRAILNNLQAELSRLKRMGGTLSIGMCDIDYFKQVNDRFGHQVGDEVLCHFTRTIQQNLRDYDLVGRYGGEEFLVVACGSTGTAQEGLYQRLCLQIAKKTMIADRENGNITVSIGVAGGTGTSTVNELLEAADSALYQAKKEGRNRVVYAASHP